MTIDLWFLVGATLLAWIMLMVASALRTQSWRKQGLHLAFGNRADLPPATAIADRGDRAARNMLENLLLFTALLLAAHESNSHSAIVDSGAGVFFFARVIYFPLYIFGVPYLRTFVWAISLLGLTLIISALV